ncbi:MAG: hypothetical protein RIG84_13505 [Roseovarius sp.]
MKDYFDLGPHSMPVTTASGEAQRWFDRGLAWCYGFNHEEAVGCFTRAAEADPACAMAYWGIANASGPNYNKQWEIFDPEDLAHALSRAFDAIQRAKAASRHVSDLEQRLIRALALRYQQPEPPADPDDFRRWNDDYAREMREVYKAYPDHFDVVALYCDALINRTPWQLWDLTTGAPAEGADTLEAKAALELAMAVMEAPDIPFHAGILHVYIHVMEMSPMPELALRAADRLPGLVPDAGHLHHMSSHIYVICGMYQDVVRVNSAAIEADRKYLARHGANNFYTFYRVHDYHFKAYGAMFLGQFEAAISAARELEATLPEDLLRVESPPMADWLEAYLGIQTHVLIRFGKWQDLIDAPLPEDPELYAMTTAMLHYAKGVAFAALGKVSSAEAQLARFEAAAARVPASRMLFNNTCSDLLEIAHQMLLGELEYRRGNFTEAYAHLRNSARCDDSLPYDEPWGWMQPTRHALGALLLEQGHVDEAAEVYEADLGLQGTLPRPCQHPENVWALHGYHECLSRQGRDVEASIIAKRLALAQARADRPIEVSCLCRLQPHETSCCTSA